MFIVNACIISYKFIYARNKFNSIQYTIIIRNVAPGVKPNFYEVSYLEILKYHYLS